MISLSIGQQRVRQLTQELLDKNASVTSPEDKWLQDELMKQLLNDPVIAGDSVTGCQVGYLEIATTYATWLNTKKWEILPFSEMARKPFQFNRMQFLGSLGDPWYGHLQEPLYKGGGKPDSVAYAILCLQMEKTHSLEFMSVKHFCNSGLTIIYSGNHRMAGYKLLGKVDFPADIIEVYNDSFDEVLNQHLIRLEILFPDLKLTGLNKLPAIQPLIALTSLYEMHPDLVEAMKKISSIVKNNIDNNPETLVNLNKGATAYKAITASSTGSTWRKLFSSKKADEPLYQQLFNWLHKEGMGYPYPDLSDSTDLTSTRTNSL